MIDRITELRAQYRNKVLKKYDLGGPITQGESKNNQGLNLLQTGTLNYSNPEDSNVSFWDKISHPKTMLFNQIGAYSEGDKKTSDLTTTPIQLNQEKTNSPIPVGQLSSEDQKLLDSIGEIGTLKPKTALEVSTQSQNIPAPTVDAPKNENKRQSNDRYDELQSLLSLPAGDMSTNFYNFGRALGMKEGTKGRGLLGVGSLGAGLLSAARMTTSGLGYSKANAYTQQYMRDQMQKNQNQYTAASQTEDTNNTGGMAKFGGAFNASTNSFRKGGFFRYKDGGEQPMQMADDGNPGQVQEEQPQMTPQQQEQIMKIAEQLVNKLGSLEAIDAYLREQKVDQQTYQAIMTIAEQMLGQEEEQPEPSESSEEQPEMKDGGNIFNKNVGDYIEFEYEGKKHSGRISKIENGQIYL